MSEISEEEYEKKGNYYLTSLIFLIFTYVLSKQSAELSCLMIFSLILLLIAGFCGIIKISIYCTERQRIVDSWARKLNKKIEGSEAKCFGKLIVKLWNNMFNRLYEYFIIKRIGMFFAFFIGILLLFIDRIV